MNLLRSSPFEKKLMKLFLYAVLFLISIREKVEMKIGNWILQDTEVWNVFTKQMLTLFSIFMPSYCIFHVAPMPKPYRWCRDLLGNYSWLPTQKKLLCRYYSTTQTETELKKAKKLWIIEVVINWHSHVAWPEGLFCWEVLSWCKNYLSSFGNCKTGISLYEWPALFTEQRLQGAL